VRKEDVEGLIGEVAYADASGVSWPRGRGRGVEERGGVWNWNTRCFLVGVVGKAEMLDPVVEAALEERVDGPARELVVRAGVTGRDDRDGSSSSASSRESMEEKVTFACSRGTLVGENTPAQDPTNL
jgi:hypothetical protein